MQNVLVVLVPLGTNKELWKGMENPVICEYTVSIDVVGVIRQESVPIIRPWYSPGL